MTLTGFQRSFGTIWEQCCSAFENLNLDKSIQLVFNIVEQLHFLSVMAVTLTKQNEASTMIAPLLSLNAEFVENTMSVARQLVKAALRAQSIMMKLPCYSPVAQ